MSGNKDILSEEVLKDQKELTEEQTDALREKVQKELYPEAGAPPAKEPKEEAGDDPEDEDDDEKDPDDAGAEDDAEGGEDKGSEGDEEKPEDTPEAKAERERQEKEAERIKAEDALLKKPEAELTAEEKTQRTEITKRRSEAAFTKEVDEYVAEKKVTVEEARKELIQLKGIRDKFKDNPREMARALRNIQREFTETREELKRLQELPRPSDLKPGEMIVDGKKLSAAEAKEFLVKSYREENEELTTEMDDEKVYQLAVKDLKAKHDSMAESHRTKIAADAKEKRSTLLASLSDEEKELLPDLEAVLKATPDHVIVHEKWNFEDSKMWARGRLYTPEKIKEIEAAAFKRGTENSEILGEKVRESAAQVKGKVPLKKTVSTQMSDEEKNEALVMYQSLENVTDEEKFKMYLELKDFDKQLDKKKKG